MTNDATVLLVCSGHETRHVYEGDKRDVEGVAGAHKARAFLGRGDVQHAREHARLIADNSDNTPGYAGKTARQVVGPVGEVLQVLALVDDGGDHPLHVIGLVRAARDDVAKLRHLRLGVVRFLGLGGQSRLLEGRNDSR